MAIQNRAVAAKPAAAVAAKPAAKPALATVGGQPVTKTTPTAILREAVMTVSTTILENGTINGEPVVSEERDIKVFATNPAFSSIKIGYNKALGGHMEMVKFDVSVGAPHYVEETDNMLSQLMEKGKAALDALITSFVPPENDAGVAGDADLVAGEAVAEETEAQPEGTIDAEYLDAADMDTMIALCTENPDLGVNPGDFPEEADLREVLKAQILGEGEAAVEGEAVADEAADEAYTEETLGAASTDDLKAVYEAWGMGKFPTGPEKIARKAAIKKILEKQEAGA
jgi:hypothetical protein